MEIITVANQQQAKLVRISFMVCDFFEFLKF
jgi:hypothetical protein